MAAPQNYVSVSRRPPDIEDYIEMLRRHRSWIIAPTFAGLVLAVVVAFLWPDTYESRAIMRIKPQSVPQELIPSMVTLQLRQRIYSLQTEILSRGRVASLISRPNLNLYPELRSRMTNEDAIDEFIKNVKIQTIEFDSTGGSGDRRLATSFQIQFSYPDRTKAKSVVDALVTQFMDENSVVQRQFATNTVGFLADEKLVAQERLRQIEAEIAKFRTANLGRLPENATSNAQMLQTLHLRLGAANDGLSRAQQNRNMAETNLKSYVSMQDLIAEMGDAGAPTQVVKNQILINLDDAIRKQELVLEALQQQYSSEYPLVKEAQKQLDLLKTNRAREESKDDSKTASETAKPDKTLSLQQQARLQQIRADIAAQKTQIQNYDLAIKSLTSERAEIDKEIRAVQARLETSPLVDQQYAQLTRDYGAAKERYEEMLRKEQLSDTSKSLEERRFGETLEVLDPANTPQAPSDPNRYMFAGIGTGMGLLIGLVFAGAREAKDSSLKNLKDVRAYTSLPVLSSVPLLENALLVRRKRRLFWLAWSSAVIIGVAAMSAAMWYYFFVPHSQ